MLLLPYVSQLSNVTSQLKDIYGLGAQLLVMIMMTCGIDLSGKNPSGCWLVQLTNTMSDISAYAH
jgi:hypothetical protein